MTLQATRDMLEGDLDKKWYLEARVEKHDGESEHWEIGPEGQIYIQVKTLRNHSPIVAVLGGGDSQAGVWYIPEEGTEVAVGFDDGEFEGDPFILAVHGLGPSGMAAGILFVRGPKVVIADADYGANPLTSEGVVVGTGIDPFTGQKYTALGSASTKVFAKK